MGDAGAGQQAGDSAAERAGRAGEASVGRSLLMPAA